MNEREVVLLIVDARVDLDQRAIRPIESNVDVGLPVAHETVSQDRDTNLRGIQGHAEMIAVRDHIVRREKSGRREDALRTDVDPAGAIPDRRHSIGGYTNEIPFGRPATAVDEDSTPPVSADDIGLDRGFAANEQASRGVRARRGLSARRVSTAADRGGAAGPRN